MDQGLKPRPYVESIMDSVSEHIHLLNMKTRENSETLRRLQPREIGSIILYLNDHGKNSATCFGCPHPDWRRTTVFGEGKGAKLSMRVIKGNPAKQVVRTGNFTFVANEVRSCIQEVCDHYKEKKTYTEILGNLSRMVSYRMHTPDFGERLSVLARAEILKDHIIFRMDHIDRTLQKISTLLEDLQPGTFHLKVLLKLESCGRDCDFCGHPRWYIIRRDQSVKTGFRRVRVDSPLPYLPRNATNFDVVNEIRNLVRDSRSILNERKKYNEQITKLARTYQGRYSL